jgi:bla regulator protein blaR1
MKLLKHSIKARILFLLASCAALLLSTPLGGVYAQKSRDDTHMTWEHTDDGLKRRFEVRGKVEFNEEYTDVISISEGGWVIIEERRGLQSYRYEVRRDTAGVLTRSFYVNGTARSLDETTRAWLSKIVLDAIRQGSFDTDKRVQRILAKSGVPGALAEIREINGSYGKRRYYEELIKQANLDAAGLRDVLKQVAGDVTSDYEQAQLLINVAPMLTGKDVAIQPFFDAVATIKSDYEHSHVLKHLVKEGTPSSAVLVLVAASTKSITSDYERRGVLTAVARAKNQSEEVLRLLLDSAAELTSDYEKATFLIEVSNVYTGDTRLRSEFLKAVETIKSDYERGRVLSTLLKNKQIS